MLDLMIKSLLYWQVCPFRSYLFPKCRFLSLNSSSFLKLYTNFGRPNFFFVCIFSYLLQNFLSILKFVIFLQNSWSSWHFSSMFRKFFRYFTSKNPSSRPKISVQNHPLENFWKILEKLWSDLTSAQKVTENWKF
jgi:hypothetical protein